MRGLLKLGVQFFETRSKCKFKLPEDTITDSNKEIKSDSFEEVCEYKILYKNNNIVVLKEDTPLMGETLTLLHFVNDETYWVYLGDDEMSDIHIREYFKRVN